jgi:transposase
MSQCEQPPIRFLGLDVHKHYLVATGVDAQGDQILGPQRVHLSRLEKWIRKTLTPQDRVVLEATSNSFELYDELVPYAHSVTVVHPPHVNLITRARVMTDKIAALALARLHAAGLLPSIWVPSHDVRDLRALVSQRTKMVRLSTQARNRLHAVIHRHHLIPPEGKLFSQKNLKWWTNLDLTPAQLVRVQTDLDTLAFARSQIERLEGLLANLAAQDERVPFLVQLPGIGMLTAMTLLSAIGDIFRFPTAKHLVGYAGMGTRVHDSGQTHRRGRITKAGRRDIRAAIIEAAHAACRTHPHWKAELARLEPRLGKNKAIVAIARKLLVAVWHVLTKGCADRFAEPELVARKMVAYAHTLGQKNRPADQTVGEYVRQQLDRLGIGAELEAIRWGKSKRILMPSSCLIPADQGALEH